MCTTKYRIEASSSVARALESQARARLGVTRINSNNVELGGIEEFSLAAGLQFATENKMKKLLRHTTSLSNRRGNMPRKMIRDRAAVGYPHVRSRPDMFEETTKRTDAAGTANNS